MFGKGFPQGKAVFPRNGKPVAKQGRKTMGPPTLCPDGGSSGCRKEQTMNKVRTWVRNFLNKEDGPTAVEYAVMLALIIVVCIVAITTLGSNANQTFTTVGNAVGTAS
jgi:pilus assembly protein Flp/PilA